MIVSTIVSMGLSTPVDIRNQTSTITFNSSDEQNVFVVGHDALNAFRSLLICSVDYPNNLFREPYCGGSVSLPLLHYEYHGPGDMHVYASNPGNSVTFQYNTGILQWLVTGLYFDVSKYIIETEDGVEYIEPWYSKYKGKTMVRSDLYQGSGRMIDSFCDRFCKVLPYNVGSPLNTPVFDLIMKGRN